MAILGIVGGLGPESTIDYYAASGGVETWAFLFFSTFALTLLLSGPLVADLPALDTTALHVDAIVRRLRV